MSTKRCLHLASDGDQCPHEDWCPIHGDVDEYKPPTMPRGILTTDDLKDYQ